MKQIQIALDMTGLDDALSVLKKTAEYIDIIEIGSPLLLSCGASAVTAVKKAYPKKLVLADAKIMDAGAYMAGIAFEAGADIVTVLAAAEDATIKGAVNEAKKRGKAVFVDMCAAHNLAGRAAEVCGLAPGCLCVHVGYDAQQSGADPIEELRLIGGLNIKKAIAGGINRGTFKDAVQSPADIIIVGSGICGQSDPAETAAYMRGITDSVNRGEI